MSSIPEKCVAVLNELYREDTIGLESYRTLSGEIERASAREAGQILGRQLQQLGIRSSEIARGFSIGLAKPIYHTDVTVVKAGNEWAVGQDGVCYMLNPLDIQLYQDLLRQFGQIIQDTGVLGFHQLDIIHRLGDDEAIVIDDVRGSAPDLLKRIVDGAIRKRASDIHLEPLGDRAEFRFRIDGECHKFGQIPADEYKALANRILENANCRAGEYREPRDGQFAWPLSHREINIRMGMVPARVAQNVWPRFALRLLGLELDLVDVSELGLSETPENPQLTHFKRALSETSGLVIVSGPTGSGKTTTLNAGLRWITRTMPTKTVFAAEDPVEIENSKVTQVEINPAQGVTFATALRSFLRQDPNVIMQGEIRDEESMELAIRASLTGHLVLTSLHTKSAIGCIPRLLDMGASRDLLSDSLAGIMAQRTVRCVCKKCADFIPLADVIALRHENLQDLRGIFRESMETLVERYGDLDQFPSDRETRIPIANPEGCGHCRNGYRGRTVIVEYVVVDNAMKIMISDGANVAAIERHARDSGYMSLWEHAVQTVAEGTTTFDEIERTLGQRRAQSPSRARDEDEKWARAS